MRYTNARLEECDPQIQKIVTKNLTRDEEGVYKYNKGILFIGDTGRGKTHAMYAIQHYLRSMSCSAITSWSEILFEMGLHYGDNKNNPNVIEHLKDKKIIFLDDLGTENRTDHNLNLMYLIVDHCYKYNKSLFLATNLELAKFVEFYGDRIATRILEVCEKFEVVGSNRRIVKK